MKYRLWRLKYKWGLLKQAVKAQDLFERAEKLCYLLPSRWYREDHEYHGESCCWECGSVYIEAYRCQVLDYWYATIKFGRVKFHSQGGSDV